MDSMPEPADLAQAMAWRAELDARIKAFETADRTEIRLSARVRPGVPADGGRGLPAAITPHDVAEALRHALAALNVDFHVSVDHHDGIDCGDCEGSPDVHQRRSPATTDTAPGRPVRRS